MGKGKKKPGKKDETPKEEVPTVSTLSISEDQPEEEGMSAASKRKAKKAAAAAAAAACAAATVVKEAPPVAPPVEEATPVAEAPTEPPTKPPEPTEEKDDEGGLGLGLDIGGAKRKRPPKKKKAPIEAAAARESTSVVPTLESPPILAPPGWMPRPSQPFPPSQPTSIAPPPGFAPPAGITLPAGIAPPVGYAPPATTRGRGRGAGQGGPDQPWSQPVRAQSPPGPSPQQAPPVKGPQGDGSSRGTETTLCRFKIPAKILGNAVPSRRVNVLTNYLPMTIKPLKINRYDVSFKPDKPKKLIPQAFTIAKAKHFAKNVVAFDQMKNCYALAPLPGVTQLDRFVTNVEVIDNNGKAVKFEVSFKGTGIVDLGTILTYMNSGGTSLNPPTEAIQCIDVVLRQGTLENYIKAGRQFFKRPANPIYLGDGLEMWTGLFQSAIFTSQPFINIDVAHKGFPRQQPLIDALVNDFRLDLNGPLERQRGRGVENFLHYIKGLRVMATVGGDNSAKGQKREFTCNDIVDPPSKMMFTFNSPGGQPIQITVADYFAREKKIRLRYPNLNCMWVGPRDKKIYYPMELLEVAYGQALNKQLNETQLSTMVREAATPPDERKRKIEEVIRAMNYPRNPYFKQFGLDIKDEFYGVQAKVLMPPKLEIGDGLNVEPRRGVWHANKLLKAEALQSWGFIGLDVDYNSSNASRIITMLMNVGSRLGMRVSEPPQSNQFYNVRIDDLQSVLLEALRKEIKFLVIVVATRGRDYYHKVKKMAERDVGILTQCIKEATASRRMNEQTARNILLKVNSKLMGINQALDGRSMPRCLAGGGVMVVGADVTHPSPEQTSVPSIAAVTASIDTKCFIYNIQLSIQTPKKEMIVEFEDMMVEHLNVYRKHQRQLPKKIFVFRDGVSEGQFAQVMHSEVQAVHDAYKRLAGPNVKPEVLFLLVQKRHHTRLFVPNSRDNVEPGTVVDTHIVHARELDFYLVSHAAIKGTSRPTRYHAVCNEGGIPHDEVEQLTYYLCHLYSRCMRSVSYPTPTYYAHLACLRARSLTFGERFNSADLEKKPQRLHVMDRILEASRMFFV